MRLSPGDRLGPYEILAPLGKGGMGEVFRARDTKLDREAAIKVLPAALAQDRERLARFEREAKVLASLNHPNIAQIYSVEESGSVHALAMELVPGANIAGPLPVETVIDYARQIGAALEAAHEKGIVHRDLKPANIMVRPDGVVKVLDFGLALLTTAEPEDPNNSPTLLAMPTQAGTILGTTGYMSPEQARGKTVDKRADIWAFGVVLYEIATGKRLFTGETVNDVLAGVLKEEPDLSLVPLLLRRLIQSCLEKDPKNRLRDIGDWAKLLDERELPATAPLPARIGSGWRIVAAATAVVAVMLAAALVGLLALLDTPVGERVPYVMGESWLRCPWSVLALSLPTLFGALWAMRGLAPTRPRAAGLAAGLLAGAVGAFGYAFACFESSTAFVALWYTLGIGMAGGLGAALGPRALRW